MTNAEPLFCRYFAKCLRSGRCPNTPDRVEQVLEWTWIWFWFSEIKLNSQTFSRKAHLYKTHPVPQKERHKKTWLFYFDECVPTFILLHGQCDGFQASILAAWNKQQHSDLPYFFAGQQQRIRHLSVNGLIPDSNEYMTYEGSLTQPGCHETVSWVLFNKPLYITAEHVSTSFGPTCLQTEHFLTQSPEFCVSSINSVFLWVSDLPWEINQISHLAAHVNLCYSWLLGLQMLAACQRRGGPRAHQKSQTHCYSWSDFLIAILQVFSCWMWNSAGFNIGQAVSLTTALFAAFGLF